MPLTGLSEFEHQVRLGFEDDVKAEILQLQRLAVILALGAAVELTPGNVARITGVILRSPVGVGPTSGSFRASWQVSYGQLPMPRVSRLSAKALVSPAELSRKVQRLSAFGVIWVATSHPAATSIELGLYPQRVVRGTWNRKRQRFEVRSLEGFSRQARQGVVGVTANEVADTLRRLVEITPV
jgi:hypothetical protein